MSRVRPHFKVHASAVSHPKTAEVFGDNDMLALWTRLGVLAIERFAAKNGDRFLVHDRELTRLTGRGRADIARTSLRHLADVSPMSVEHRGDMWLITFPNFARKQGFTPKNERSWEHPETLRSETLRSEKKHTPPLSARASPPTTTKVSTRKTNGTAKKRAAAKRVPKRPKTEAPDPEEPEAWLRLNASVRPWCEAKHEQHAPKIEEHVAACFDWHRANDVRRCDWAAAVRAWIRKQDTINTQQRTRTQGTSDLEGDISEWLATEGEAS